MALSAMKNFANRQSRKTFEIELVAQHVAELAPNVTCAGFQLKRRGRLSVADAVEVQGGCAEWNTLCKMTATLHKEPSGEGWRPKDFVFKVRQHERVGAHTHGRTVAKASLDLSPYCQPEPFGPHQITVPLRPQGLLTVSIRTRWLQNYDRDADTLTDASFLSAAPTATTGLGSTAAEDQDLEGFEGLNIKAVYPPPLTSASCSRSASPAKRPLLGLASGLRGAASSARQSKQGTPACSASASPAQQRQLAACSGEGAGFGGFGSARRRPEGATPLQLSGCGSSVGEAEASGDGAVPTPTLIMGGGGGSRVQHGAAQQGGQQSCSVTPVTNNSPVKGLAPEQWSPVDLEQARAQLQSSDEEDGADRRRRRPGRSFMRWWGGGETPEVSPMASPMSERVLIDRETDLTQLKQRSRRLLSERDEAREEGYAAQSEALRCAVELDSLARTKDMLAQRLAVTEERLMAMCKDEASGALVASLVEAKVELADKDFAILELQGEVRRYKSQVEHLHTKLTKLETQYRTALDALTEAAEKALKAAAEKEAAEAVAKEAAAVAAAGKGVAAAGKEAGAAAAAVENDAEPPEPTSPLSAWLSGRSGRGAAAPARSAAAATRSSSESLVEDDAGSASVESGGSALSPNASSGSCSVEEGVEVRPISPEWTVGEELGAWAKAGAPARVVAV